MTQPEHDATSSASQDEWYERERAAFIVWWEAEGQNQFSETPTLAAGAGWLARAEAMNAAPEITDAEKSRAFEWLRGLAISESTEPATARLAGVALAEWHACKAAIPSATEQPSDLLRACKMLLERVKSECPDPNDLDEVQLARIAIARAEGRL